MSNRLGGKQGTAYLGTNANQPPNMHFEDRDPGQYDIQNVSLGDLWLNTENESLWVLVSLQGDASSKGSLATWTLLQSGGGSGELDTLTGDTGGAITPDGASNINLVSGIAGFTFDGSPGSHTITLNSTGGPTDVVQSITGNSGGPVDPVLGNINIVGDGTSVNVVGNPGTHTLTVSLVGGAGAAIEEIDGDTGAAIPIGGLVALIADQAALGAGSSVAFNAAGNVITFNVTDGNDNTIVGHASGNLVLSGVDNAVFGDSSIPGLLTGSRNVVMGSTSGTAYTTNESDNILIGAIVPGTVGDQNVLQIGKATGTGNGELNEAFIHGIRGITPAGGNGIPVFIDSFGQLGTVGGGGGLVVETLTGNAGGAVSPTAGNINIVGDGTSITITGNPGTSTLTASVIGGGSGVLTMEGDSGGPIAPMAGLIDIITDLAALGAGSTVSFIGSGNMLELGVTDALNNTILGADSGNLTLTGTNNAVFGRQSATSFTTAASNTIVGATSGAAITTGQRNTILGRNSAIALTTGANNIVVGGSSAANYTGAESNNIIIGTTVTGTAAESNALRIGLSTGAGTGQLNKSFIAGIRGITPTTNDGIPVYINSVGQLGTVGTGIIATATGNTGLAVPADGLHNINIKGDGIGVTVAGTPGTNTLTISLVGGGGGASIEEIDGDTGTAIPNMGVVNIIADQAALGCGKTVAFVGSGDTLELAVTDGSNNTIVGADSGRLAMSGDRNTVFGSLSATNLTSGFANTIIGYSSGTSMTGGSNNTIVGGTTGSSITAGTTNTLIGRSNATGITTGSNNIVIGSASASSYTSSESNNIMIGNGIAGTVNENNALRIGVSTGTGAGQINKTFIAGIDGRNVGSVARVVTENNNQLGTATLTAGSGITIAPTANTITISATGGGGGGGSVSSFSAYLNTEYSVSSPSSLPIMYDKLLYNEGSDFDIGTSTFTAPVSGLYNFCVGIGIYFTGTIPTNTSIGGLLRVNGGNNIYQLFNTAGAATLQPTLGNQYIDFNGSAYILLNAGDTVQAEFQAFKATGSFPYKFRANPIFPTINAFNYFSGSLVSNGGGSGDAGIAFSAYLTNNITYTPANSIRTVTYDTVDFDLDGNYDTSNGKFTAPLTGLYHFTCSMTVKCGTASSTQPQIKVYMATSSGLRLVSLNNATTFVYNSLTDTTYNGYMSVSGAIYSAMDAGDIAIIQVGVFANNLTGSNVTFPGTSTFGPIGAPIIPNTFGGSLISS